jgi:uncharacterized membrane protein HdeD (DUF308 family)
MSDTSLIGTPFHGRLRASSTQLLVLGVIMLLLGVVALVFPMISTLVATLLAGWTLLFAGVITFAGAFSIHGTGPFFGAMLTGLISFAAGVFLVFNPLHGAIALTILLGVIFLFQGAFEIVFAFETRPHPGWQWMLVSGIASIVMAAFVAAGWPAISLVLLGILLGINFITTGMGYIFISRAAKAVA